MKEPPPPVSQFQLGRSTRPYNGSTKPQDWLADYVSAVYIAGGNRRWAVRYLPHMLEGPARIWLNNLPENSIDCWLDLEEAFNSNFASTYRRPNRPQLLQACKQEDNETDREFLTRWSNVRNSCEGVIEAQAIAWFADGCRYGSMLWQRLQRDMPKTLAETIRIADSYALGDPMQPLLDGNARNRRNPMNNRNNGPRFDNRQEFGQKRREPDFQVNAVNPSQSGSGGAQKPKIEGQAWTPNQNQNQGGGAKQWQESGPPVTYESLVNGPCIYHGRNGRTPNHTTLQCSFHHRTAAEGAKAGANRSGPPNQWRRPQYPNAQQQNKLTMAAQNQSLTGANSTPVHAAQNQKPAQAKPVNAVSAQGNNNDGGVGQSQTWSFENQRYENPGNDYREVHQSYVVFVTESTDKKSMLRRAKEVNAVTPAVVKYMNWSEQEITWSRQDTPRIMPSPGNYALVVDPTFCGPTNNVRFTRVLVDNGSAINIMYRDTMVKLGYSPNQLQPSSCTFHGIVPGVSCAPMGKIWVDVGFGTRDNSRVESLEFEVVDLQSPYHALLGRPALAKFMISTHVAYLKMKMPGPKGIITISGDYKKAMQCASAGSSLAESLVIAAEKKQLQKVVAMAQSTQLGMSGLITPDMSASFEVPKETKKIPLDSENPERFAIIGTGMDEK